MQELQRYLRLQSPERCCARGVSSAVRARRVEPELVRGAATQPLLRRLLQPCLSHLEPAYVALSHLA